MMDPQSRNEQLPSSEGQFYEIHVRGHLTRCWSEWLGDLNLKLLDNGEMILYGMIVDQAALLGVLNKLNRLNLALLSVNVVKKEKESEEI